MRIGITRLTDHFRQIYTHDADRYERLVTREDQRGNLFSALMNIHPFDGQTIVEFGAGTGRMTRILSVLAQHIYAVDIAAPMLHEGARVLEETGMENWSLMQADNRAVPLASGIADIAVEGWSFGHVAGWYPDTWQAELDAMLAEMRRVLKPDGTLILLETMGTGQRQPQAPTDALATLYAYLEDHHGFTYQWIRTDYQFESVAEADELMRMFFGDAMAETLIAGKNIIVPECTGIWHRKRD
jgi:ubiquinone/menaquinone biosynthesis C-methylase UbiE